MDKFRNLILMVCVLSLVLTGCKKNTSSKEYGYYAGEYASLDQAYSFDYEEDVLEGFVNESKSIPAAAESSAAIQQRMIRKSASINIQVMDPIKASDDVIYQTETMGGFVVSSSISQEYYNGEITLPRADLTIRVPAERLNEMLEFIEKLTTDSSKYVSNKHIYGVDITSEYVDSTSRLSSLEKTLDKLYEIMDSAENAEEALEVYKNIAEIETEIEVMKGQIKYMSESVAYSSVEVRITSIRPDPIRTVQKWSLGDVIKDSFESLLENGKDAIEFLVYFVIVYIPILILIAIPIVLIIWIIRKVIISHKKKNNKIASSEITADFLEKPKGE